MWAQIFGEWALASKRVALGAITFENMSWPWIWKVVKEFSLEFKKILASFKAKLKECEVHWDSS